MPGTDEGCACDRDGCTGTIEFTESENCSCHISPPCHACTSVHLHCPVCGWEGEPPADPQPTQAEKDVWAKWAAEQEAIRNAPLNNTKVSWRSKSHSSCSMIKEGVYPQSGDSVADMAMVRKEVDGTFGGHFEQFGNGRFLFIAYTD